MNFFITTLTIPKTKDLVNTNYKKYNDIYNIIYNNEHDNVNNALPIAKNNDNKQELKNFLKTQMHNNNTINNTSTSLDNNDFQSLSNNDSNLISFSEYK